MIWIGPSDQLIAVVRHGKRQTLYVMIRDMVLTMFIRHLEVLYGIIVSLLVSNFLEGSFLCCIDFALTCIVYSDHPW